MEIRALRLEERAAWLRLRGRLWPNTSRAELAQEIEEILAESGRNAVLVAASGAEEPVGFIEVSIRDWAEGCETRPVGYIEGWYVEPQNRREGVGRRLVEAAENWVLSQGCSEIGSDAELQNELSHAAHRAIGFAEVTRLVLFSKKLTP